MNDAGAREAVVVDGDGVVCGLFDATCMLHWAPDDALQGLGDIDLQPLSTVPQFLPQAPLGGVLDALLDRGLECAVAANRGAQPQGLLTPHALAQLIVRAAPIEQLSLGDCVLRLSPALCAPLSVADAVRHRRQLGLRQLPIVRNGKLAGLLDADQLADRLASDDQPEGERGPRSRESELEQLKTRLEDEVAQRTHQLEAAMRELESFSYSISHDLRAPLRAIEGFSRLLQTDHGDTLDTQGRDYLERIRLAAQRMAALIDDMLDLARLSRKALKCERVDLSAQAHAVCEELRNETPEREVEVFIQPGLRVVADPLLMRVVLQNLLGNAWKFTARSARAQIRFEKITTGPRIEFQVSDNGAGFDMNYAEKLFQPFQRLHPQREFDGTGIGLATVQRIVQRHGGAVSARGEPDAGAVFSFWIGRPKPAADSGPS
jgi:signal transduction histidine kinase